MSASAVEPSTKMRIVWGAYNRRDEQIFNSLAEHIKIHGTGVDSNTGIIMTGDMRDNPEDEHPSLIFRTRWDRVFWALNKNKVSGMEEIKTSKQLLEWAVNKDSSLFDYLRDDVQEWLTSNTDKTEISNPRRQEVLRPQNF